MNLAEYLTKNAEKYPLKPAIGFKKDNEWKEISWKYFQKVVAKTANSLVNFGIKSGDKIAIYSENSAEWICFDLAIMMIGAISVPIYATNNGDQTEYVLNDSEAKMILVGNQEQYDVVYDLLEKTSLEQIIVSKKSVWIKKEKSIYFEDFIKDGAEEFLPAQKSNDDLLTLIYTSGTTGVPKGVMLSHGNFLSAFEKHIEFYQFKALENEHSLAFLPLTHVFERCWTHFCLSNGVKVSFSENPKLIAHALVEVKPTMMCAVPRFYQKIYAGVQDMVGAGSNSKKKIFNWALSIGSQVAELKRRNQEIPFSLSLKNSIADKLVFSKIKNKMGGKLWFMPCGGASISSDVTEFFDAMGIHITVGYGLTETTATLTAFPFTGYCHGSAGKPLAGTEIKIGVNSEILVRGSGVMKGYYKKPEETAKVIDEDGWFRTGDAGVIDEEGNLIITDRLKDLMKTSNGKYVAPQPIENMLSNNNYIHQIMLIAEGRPFVSALVVPNFEFLQKKLDELKINFTNWKDILDLQPIKELYKQKIDEFQHSLPSV